ncbi:DUF692 family protein [Streptomyces sp. B-S-A8]|uniref:DUF692 family protein n=1 Tax=Streptomyces solicavernae TaxID=3043614 RepID=A0ABT6RYG4_9ACTN|nr:DUF692 family multinuclear iron-containing protein [Streptomyces sp. B-S-A8]MDI3389478.1 DUF692 family protein [Streptomyces sp. B-S-A8]
MQQTAHLGTGMGWRPEIAEAVERMPGLDWVEVVAENVCPGHLPDSLTRLRERGVTVVPHGVGLGIGGAERPDPDRLSALAERAEALGAPLVTEHIAFVRAGGALTASPRLEAGHLLPVPRTKDSLDVLCEHVRIAQDALPVPLALENIAALIAWPGEEMTEGQFLYDLVDRTGVRLLIDVANLHTNHVNRDEDPCAALDGLPVEAIAYVHVAGGFERDGVWHDSHAHPVTQPVLDVLAELASRVSPPGVLLERDENFPAPEELERELQAIRRTVAAGAARRLLPATPERAAELVTAGPAPMDYTSTEHITVGRPSGAPLGTGTPPPATETEAGPEPESDSAATEAGPEPESDSAATEAGPEPESDSAATEAGPEPESDSAATEAEAGPETARQRLALAQAALLSALVAGTPAPEGFDRQRLAVQSRALTGKRADVVAKVAPELPAILGDAYRPGFFAYAAKRPMTGGYRRDALDFAEHLLLEGGPEQTAARRELSDWWLERSGPAPVSTHPLARFVRRVRYALTGR